MQASGILAATAVDIKNSTRLYTLAIKQIAGVFWRVAFFRGPL
jgi:hypothetical protein